MGRGPHVSLPWVSSPDPLTAAADRLHHCYARKEGLGTLLSVDV